MQISMSVGVVQAIGVLPKELNKFKAICEAAQLPLK
jgi:hypothetical protein